jgi:hypothetical protein
VFGRFDFPWEEAADFRNRHLIRALTMLTAARGMP